MDNSEFKNSKLSIGEYWYNWTRSPIADSSDTIYVHGVSPEGDVTNSYLVPFYYFGVRPAFYINLKGRMFKLGIGTVDKPYILDDNWLDATP